MSGLGLEARMGASYRAYGLALSSSVVLPGLRLAAPAAPDVRFNRGSRDAFARARAQLTPRPRRRGWFLHRELRDGTTYLRWSGLFEFLIAADGRRILYRRERDATLESFSVYLLGQVLSFSLIAFGVEPLHGTVVDIGGGAVAFLGDCGFGKSTLGASLLARGCRLLSDDLVALDQRPGGWTVHPGIPRLKLYPSVARVLLGRDVRGTPMNHGTSKLVLPLGANHAGQRALSLRAIYVLADPESSGCGASVRIDHLSGREAFLEIVRGAFNLLVHHHRRLTNQFEFARRLVDTVPIRRLTYPRALSSLPAACDAVFADVHD